MRKALPLVLILSALFFVTTPARATYLLDQSGYLIKLNPLVLGDQDEIELETESESNDIEDDNTSSELRRESEQKVFEQKREQQKKQDEVKREAAKKKLEQQLEQNKKRVKTNVETRVKVKDGKLNVEQTELQNNARTKKTSVEFERAESLKVEGEDGQFTEIKPAEKPSVSEIKERVSKEPPETKEEFELTKNRIKTRTNLELKVGEKNEITVTLPNGKEKEISIPDKALENLISKGIITQKDGESSYELTTNKSGEPVYQAEGQVEKKILGLFKIKVAQKLEVAASNSEDGTVQAGDVINTETVESNPLRRFLSRFAY